jgi:hypothetical protein
LNNVEEATVASRDNVMSTQEKAVGKAEKKIAEVTRSKRFRRK